MIVRQLLRAAAPRTFLVRNITSSTAARQSPGGEFPPVIQRAADTAVRITQEWTGMMPPPPSALPPPPASIYDPTQPPVKVPGSQVFVHDKADPTLQLFAALLMQHGKLERARKKVAEMLLYISSQTHADPLPLVKEALRRAAPAVRLASHKQGANVKIVPFPLNERARTRYAIQWIISNTIGRSEKGLHRRLAGEMFDIMNGKGKTLQQKFKVHQDASLNRYAAPHSAWTCD